MKTPHKHAELIKAWADGAEIQVYDVHNEIWRDSSTPIWDVGLKYRIKSEPKPDIVMFRWVYPIGSTDISKTPNIKLTFDSGTGKLKSAEVL